MNGPGWLNAERLRPADIFGLLVVLLVVTWWAWMLGSSHPLEPTRDTAPAPWTPATSGEPTPTEVDDG